MRRKKAFGRGRVISILVAAGVGYLLGSWNAAAVRGTEPSGGPTAAQTVALRFPRGLGEAVVVQAAAYEHPAASAATARRDEQIALFEPEPMVPRSGAPQAAAEPAPEQTADIAPTVPAQPAPAAAAPILPKLKKLMSAAKPHPALARRQANRPGHMLDEAQIASIKRRLHLTPDQKRMWPAVAAALRNIGFERAREVRGRDAAGAIDPNSPEVQDLKSAAIPLIMSFSDDQKDEVRNLARGMGLDQLASQF